MSPVGDTLPYLPATETADAHAKAMTPPTTVRPHVGQSNLADLSAPLRDPAANVRVDNASISAPPPRAVDAGRTAGEEHDVLGTPELPAITDDPSATTSEGRQYNTLPDGSRVLIHRTRYPASARPLLDHGTRGASRRVTGVFKVHEKRNLSQPTTHGTTRRRPDPRRVTFETTWETLCMETETEPGDTVEFHYDVTTTDEVPAGLAPSSSRLPRASGSLNAD